MLLPRTCPLCHRAGAAPCPACAASLVPAPSLAVPAGCDACRAVLAYHGAGREIVARLKYRNARSTLAWLATEMAGLVDPHDVDVATWIPTTARRRRHRGFDQAELLARAVARRLRVPCRALLVRGPGPPQTGRTGTERHAGPILAVRGSGPLRPVPARVLVVDDVITTGSTMSRAARALVDAGVDHVIAVAAARTPLKRARVVPDTQVR